MLPCGGFFILYLIFSIILLSSCGRGTLYNKIDRVISLSPAATEIIYSLKADEKLVGVTSYCNYPEAAKSKEIVGNFSNPSIEKILSLKPDLVILAGKGQLVVDRKLKELNLRTYTYSVGNLSDIILNVQKLGKLLDKEIFAEKLIKKFKKDIKYLKSKNRILRKKVFIELNVKPLYTCGRKSFVNDILKLAGLENISEEFSVDYIKVNIEWVLRKKPDYIILTSAKKDTFLKLYPVFKDFKIIDNVNPDIIVRPSLRILEGAKKLREVIYEK